MKPNTFNFDFVFQILENRFLEVRIHLRRRYKMGNNNTTNILDVGPVYLLTTAPKYDRYFTGFAHNK